MRNLRIYHFRKKELSRFQREGMQAALTSALAFRIEKIGDDKQFQKLQEKNNCILHKEGSYEKSRFA